MPKLLYVDDRRIPQTDDTVLVTSYDEFVEYVSRYGVPDLVSFDHDLADPAREKSGFACARYLVQNQIPIKHWNVHTANLVGRGDIENELRAYYPEGEVKLKIKSIHQEEEV
jgi:hypothetical protein